MVIFIGDRVWIHSSELRNGWMCITCAEMGYALEELDFIAHDAGLDMHHYDNFNIGMLVREDRRFKEIASQLEGS